MAPRKKIGTLRRKEQELEVHNQQKQQRSLQQKHHDIWHRQQASLPEGISDIMNNAEARQAYDVNEDRERQELVLEERPVDETPVVAQDINSVSFPKTTISEKRELTCSLCDEKIEVMDQRSKPCKCGNEENATSSYVQAGSSSNNLVDNAAPSDAHAGGSSTIADSDSLVDNAASRDAQAGSSSKNVDSDKRKTGKYQMKSAPSKKKKKEPPVQIEVPPSFFALFFGFVVVYEAAICLVVFMCFGAFMIWWKQL